MVTFKNFYKISDYKKNSNILVYAEIGVLVLGYIIQIICFLACEAGVKMGIVDITIESLINLFPYACIGLAVWLFSPVKIYTVVLTLLIVSLSSYLLLITTFPHPIEAEGWQFMFVMIAQFFLAIVSAVIGLIGRVLSYFLTPRVKENYPH